jgi:hypothetical protein
MATMRKQLLHFPLARFLGPVFCAYGTIQVLLCILAQALCPWHVVVVHSIGFVPWAQNTGPEERAKRIERGWQEGFLH